METKNLALLNPILNKEPIVATVKAQTLLDAPENVHAKYLEHVRSFVVLNALGEQTPVEEYQKRLIRLVKERQAVKGYITADFGYGKTSTALYVWYCCEQADIVAVPPFQIQQLPDLITATYGWVRYKLANRYPALVAEAEQIYRRYIVRSIEDRARNEGERELLQTLFKEGSYSLELPPVQYIHFLEDMTALAHKAQYSGLVILADELQQYIEPQIKAGYKDPIAPLFSLIEELMTYKGRLSVGLIFSMPLKELGLLNDQRSDLVQRLKSDQLALDLSAIYNQNFAGALWERLSHRLEFETWRDRVIEPIALEALGQISARPDLATGPRTVVDVFNLICRRYQEAQGRCEPFSPLDLVDAFLEGKISYDQTAKLQQVVNRQLSRPLMQTRPDYQKAIKLMAAFPLEGLPDNYFDQYGVREAIASLTEATQGDIIAYAGGGIDERGQLRPRRARLVGLEERKTDTNWLVSTLRDFLNNNPELSHSRKRLVFQGFEQLLRRLIFKEGTGNWKVLREPLSSSIQNRVWLFEGTFNSFRKKFPLRQVEVQLIEGEPIRPNTTGQADLTVWFELKFYDDLNEQERRLRPGQLTLETDKVIHLALNLNYNDENHSYADLHPQFDLVLSPWKITPAILLGLYAYLEEKRVARLIPKAEDGLIKAVFQPSLLDHALKELFSPELGLSFNSVGLKIVEDALTQQLSTYYSTYETLMSNSTWRANLNEYRDLLRKLPTPQFRQGHEPYKATKQDMAKLLVKSVPAFDTFVSSYPLLLHLASGGWWFKLHPVEEQILTHLKNSPLTTAAEPTRHYTTRQAVFTELSVLGYRNAELEAALQLLEARDLLRIENSGLEIVEQLNKIPNLSELRVQTELFVSRVNVLKIALPEHPQIIQSLEEIKNLPARLKHLTENPDERTQLGLANTLRSRLRALTDLVEVERARIAQEIARHSQEGLVTQIDFSLLEKSIRTGFFSSELDNYRLKLLSDNQKNEALSHTLQQHLNDLYRWVRQTPLPDEEIGELIDSYQQLQNSLESVQTKSFEIKRTFSTLSK